MRTEITISELAKLMSVSVHQIRYFEEKGVLMPAYIDDNQYRMYNFDQIYELSHILLLRKLGISVQGIKECMTSYDSDQYEQLFQHSLQEVEAEITRLTELQHFIQKVLHEHHSFSHASEHFKVIKREKTYLAPWVCLDAHEELHARRLAEQAESLPNLFESDIHYVWEGSGTTMLAIESQEPTEWCMPDGDYLSCHRQLHAEEQLEDVIQQFYDDAARTTYALSGPVILIEKSYLSLFSKNKLHYELLSFIKP
ncbi:MerR family transcriptional regulator [Paenibacillus sp. 1001270B_150601_E10]|uniref:helix-turn-helix domain-containing protein n=1 Tax=Paenibacillus sp. 1001270B_150601_E10 TaxID=2787079 RepID=UPI00189D586C|nr:MerR family transcriptional regulator [Paenibacillus sp. 1001270B_150601_E10]